VAGDCSEAAHRRRRLGPKSGERKGGGREQRLGGRSYARGGAPAVALGGGKVVDRPAHGGAIARCGGVDRCGGTRVHGRPLLVEDEAQKSRGWFKGETDALGALGRMASEDRGGLGAAGCERRKKGEELALMGRTQRSERGRRWGRRARAGENLGRARPTQGKGGGGEWAAGRELAQGKRGREREGGGPGPEEEKGGVLWAGPQLGFGLGSLFFLFYSLFRFNSTQTI
jgi:hypothetical protein